MDGERAGGVFQASIAVGTLAESLPHAAAVAAAHACNPAVFRALPWVKGLPPLAAAAVAGKLKPFRAAASEPLALDRDLGHCLFFLQTGAAEQRLEVVPTLARVVTAVRAARRRQSMLRRAESRGGSFRAAHDPAPAPAPPEAVPAARAVPAIPGVAAAAATPPLHVRAERHLATTGGFFVLEDARSEGGGERGVGIAGLGFDVAPLQWESVSDGRCGGGGGGGGEALALVVTRVGLGSQAEQLGVEEGMWLMLVRMAGSLKMATMDGGW